MSELEEINISLDELEAVRLKDLEGLEQEQGAEKMNVSRPTFQRILSSARQKLADALLNGKALKFQGGNFELINCRFRCHAGHEWELASPARALPKTCPTCHSFKISPAFPETLASKNNKLTWAGTNEE
jgi:predicted DNA-binding protein (UPF0251 family)